MTRDEALQVFDEVYPEILVEARCCGLPVVMNSQDGTSRIYCSQCGRTIEELGGERGEWVVSWRRWVVSDWGRRGMPQPGATRGK